MKKPKVFFRADGHAKMGLGHVIRSLALADMLKEQFHCAFMIRNPLPSLQQQILQVCENLIELPESENDLEEANHLSQKYLQGDEIVVLDGYHFTTTYQQIIKNKGCKIVAIDDIHACHFVTDVLINHAGGLKNSDYSAEPYTQFCLGLPYVLLRKPFREAAQNRNYPNRKADNIFICLGGADPNNDTLGVLKKCIESNKFRTFYVVIGGAYQYRKELDDFIANLDFDIKLLSNLSAEEMVHYMKQCETAVTPPSTTSYEYLSVGGDLYLKVIADNQKRMHSYLTSQSLAKDFDLDFNSQVQRTTNPFDGQQKKRFLRLFNALRLKVRKATKDDLMLCFHWANDPMVRQQSYNTAPIALENHTKWFTNKIKSSNSIIYIMELEETPIGQIRFDMADEVATISYALDKDYRGRGLGEGILRAGIAALKREKLELKNIQGFVKKNNIPSQKAFRALGCAEEEAHEYPDSFKYIVV